MGTSMQPNERVPLDMLPYFRYLNNEAQRSIMKQLIDKFQSTGLTAPQPRADSAAVVAAAAAAAAGPLTAGQGAGPTQPPMQVLLLLPL